MSGLRDSFLSLTARKYSDKPLTIAGVGSVLARTLTEAERGDVENAAAEPGSVKRWCLIHGIVDAEKREPIFRAEDFEALGRIQSPVVNLLADAVLKLNRFSQEDLQQLLGEPKVG